MLQRIVWNPTQAHIDLCKLKGKSDVSINVWMLLNHNIANNDENHVKKQSDYMVQLTLRIVPLIRVNSEIISRIDWSCFYCGEWLLIESAIGFSIINLHPNRLYLFTFRRWNSIGQECPRSSCFLLHSTDDQRYYHLFKISKNLPSL